ncbi:hypothetical protein ABZ837_37335 [Streptomyces sp. NPDC047197]|uniref:hypothetical protein n=1 Tax=Streptomyces sp. NPDC047197 TaxID=3155477 RepID=UPI0033DCCA97
MRWKVVQSAEPRREVWLAQQLDGRYKAFRDARPACLLGRLTVLRLLVLELLLRMHELLLDQPELLLRLLKLFLKLFEIGVELLLVELVFLVGVPKAEAGDDAAGNGDERSAKPGDDDPGGRCEASVLVADPVVLEDPGPPTRARR